MNDSAFAGSHRSGRAPCARNGACGFADRADRRSDAPSAGSSSKARKPTGGFCTASRRSGVVARHKRGLRAGDDPGQGRIDGSLPEGRSRLSASNCADLAAGRRESFALCSSLGADAASRFTYLRTKGQLEDDLCKVGFPSVTIIRPGFIEGERSDRRPFQRLTAEFCRLRPILPRQYRLSPAPVIARLLIDGAVAGLPGRHIVEAGDIADRLR